MKLSKVQKEIAYSLMGSGFFLALLGSSAQNCLSSFQVCSGIYWMNNFQTLLFSGATNFVYDYSINIFGFILLYVGIFLYWRCSTVSHLNRSFKIFFTFIILGLMIADLPLINSSSETKFNCTPTSCGVPDFETNSATLSIFEILSTFYTILAFSFVSIGLGTYYLFRYRAGRIDPIGRYVPPQK